MFILCKQVSAFCNHIFSYTSIKKQGISTFVACHAKRKKLTRKTKKTLLNTTFKSVFYYL